MNPAEIGIYVCLFIGLYFEVFLLISFLEKRPTQKTTERPLHYPSVSMIVPCFNEEKTIAGTIESLLSLDYPKDKLHIVVVDDGSTDNTRAIAESYKDNSQVVFFHKENGGKYTALNLGITNTTSDIIGCLDADSFVVKDGLLEMVKMFESDKTIMALAPAMKVFRPRSILELMQAVEYTFGIFYKKMFDNLSAVSVLPGPFSLYRREVFNTVGLFRHAHNTEDMEITFRMHAHGLKIANAHNAWVYTTVPKTIRALVKQRTRWSQGYLQNSADYWYMYFNPRFGHFGMLVLPFGLIAFFGGLYTAGYAFFKLVQYVSTKVLDLWTTQIPLHAPTMSHIGWFYLNTSMMTVLVATMLCMTLLAVYLGQQIAETKLSVKSYVSYIAFFGLLAPLWLAQAAWGAIRAKDSAWR